MYEGEDPLSEYDDGWLTAKWDDVVTPAQNLARSANTTSSPNNSNNNSSNNNNSNNNVAAASSSSPNPQSTGRTTRKTATALELPPEDVLEMSNQLTLQKQNYSALLTRYQDLEKKHVTLQKQQVPSTKPAQPSRAKSNRGKTEEKKKKGGRKAKEVSEESESEESEYDTEETSEESEEDQSSTTEESESDSESSGERKRKSTKSSGKKHRKHKNAKESKKQKKKRGKNENKHKRSAEKMDQRGGEKKKGQKGERNDQPLVQLPMQYQFPGQPLPRSYVPSGPAAFQMPPTPQHDPRVPMVNGMGYAFPFPQHSFPGQHQQVVEYCSQCENAPATFGNLCSHCYMQSFQQQYYAKPGTPRMLTNPPKK
jgi:hypothetical protein